MFDPLSPAADADLEALSRVARTLEPVMPHERRAVQREEAALLLDGLLVRVARGRGAIDLALGDGLASLSVGDRLLRLGFSSLGDYARERLGIAGSTAEKAARLARNLAERPLLRQAVHAGEVSPRKAETIVPVAHGEAEAAWVARAKVETVRALGAGVKAAAGDGAGGEEERWERVAFPVRPGAREKLDEALALAGKLLGPTTPRWQRLEAICQEYLGAHPFEPDPEEVGDPAACLLDHAPSGRSLDELKAWLEKETDRWAFIASFDPAPGARLAPGAGGMVMAAGEVAAGGVGLAGGEATAGGEAVVGREAAAVRDDPSVPASPHAPVLDLARLDADLRRLRDLRSRWDEVFGHLAMLLRHLGLWRDMQFTDFGHYCSERLGMCERAVSQRASLERRLYELPALRAAMRAGRVTYEKARIVAAVAGERTLDAWIERASRLPCIALAREAEVAQEQQTCAARELSCRLPRRVASLLVAALRSAQAASGKFLTAGQALEVVASHFIAAWKPLLEERNTLQRRVLDRDRAWCQVPGCSRAALHVHHVRFRSHGGADVAANLVSLCAAHHLHGVHAGYLRVAGEAPHRLRWGFRAAGGPTIDPAAARAEA